MRFNPKIRPASLPTGEKRAFRRGATSALAGGVDPSQSAAGNYEKSLQKMWRIIRAARAEGQATLSLLAEVAKGELKKTYVPLSTSLAE